MRKSSVLLGVATALALPCFGNMGQAASSYSTGFEDFTTGPMSSGSAGPTQGGWSGGESGGFTNNNAGDEEIVTTQHHTGGQSWHYANGYNSPGSGTPFTPNVTPAVSHVGDSISGSLWFKAGTAGDGSGLSISTGDTAGQQRSEILAYVYNNPGGITVNSYTNGAAFDSVAIASGLDASIWHELAFSLTLTSTANDISIAIDGGTPVNFEGSLYGYDISLSGPYVDSSRLKFAATQGNIPGYDGYYLDDISYSATSAVPEPASLALLGLGAVALLAKRRRKA